MKKTFFVLGLAAATCMVMPSCDSPQEERNENTEREMERIEDAADDVDNEPLEDAADKAGDAADDRE